MESQNKPTICIIGAGISGLHAADILSNQLWNVHIFEAKARIGGRILALEDFTKTPIDIGAQFIHGTNSPHYRIAQEAGIPITEEGTLKTQIEYDGKIRDYEEVCNLRNCEYLEKWEEDWEAEFAENIRKDDISVESFLNTKEYTKGLEHYAVATIANEWASSLDSISVKGAIYFNKMFKDFGFESFMFDQVSNYELIIQRYKEAIKNVKLETPIVKVKYDKEKVTLTSKDGTEYEADFVILAVPISIIQSNIICFEPSIPSDQRKVIDSIETGSIIKILLKFSQAFWEKGTFSIVLNGLAKCFWVAGVSPLNKEKHTTLVASVSGKDLLEIRSLGKEQTIKRILEDLKRNFGEIVEQVFEKATILDWGLEDYIQGAYTFPSLKEIPGTRDAATKNLNNRIFFIGEWASPTGRYSSIGAAMESAESVTKQILELCEEKSLFKN